MTITIKLDPRTIDVLQKLFGHSSEPTALERLEGKIDMVAANQKETQKRMSAISNRLDKLDAASNKVAAALKKLRDRLASGEPATPEELARFDASVSFLEQTGKDPETEGVPEVPPVLATP